MEAKAAHAVLSPTETDEILRTERMVLNQEHLLQTLETEAAHAKIDLDMATVQAAWLPLVEQKAAAYAAFLEVVASLAEAVTALERVHHQQDLLLRELPKQVYDRLSFADPSTFVQRLGGRLPLGWGPAVLQVEPLTRGQWQPVLDADMGLRPLPARAIERFNEERRP
jgi:hypothetical protein